MPTGIFGDLPLRFSSDEHPREIIRETGIQTIAELHYHHNSQLQEGRAYTIVNVSTGTVIDLSGSDGHTIFGWERNNGANQKWIPERHDRGWAFRNQNNSNLYLSLNEVSPSNGNRIISQGHAYVWILEDAHHGDGTFTLKPPHATHLVFDMYGNNKDNGTQVCLWDSHGGSNQAWRFE